MKTNFTTIGFLAAATVLLLAGRLPAQTFTRYQAEFAGSKVTIAGTSTIHDWTAEGQLIGGSLELDSAFPVDPAQKTAAPGKVNAKVSVTIPVRSLKCSSGPAMDTVMQNAMTMEKYPKIEYTLKELALRDPTEAGKPMRFNSEGELTVCGVKKVIRMPVTIEPAGAGKLKIVGTVPLKMTDFKIQPPAPKLALGMIKTGDDVQISLTWMIAVPAK